MKKNKTKKTNKLNKKPLKIAALIAIIAVLAAPLLVNAYVLSSTAGFIVREDEVKDLGADCILVLGAGVWEGGRPSAMLEDRLLKGIELYNSGAAGKLLMSGDHGTKDYDEVNVMKDYAVKAGVPSEDVFMDHAGFSTYESVYRARDIFLAEKIIIVTQEYHLPRALYTAKSLGLDAVGVASDRRGYSNMNYHNMREFAARLKDFGYSILKPPPTYLGDTIPVFGDGDVTNDKLN